MANKSINVVLTITLFIGIMSGCIPAGHRRHVNTETQAPDHHLNATAYISKFGKLQDDLAILNQYSNLSEAERIAQEALNYSAYLAEEYDLVQPAVLHNVFVRLGFKNRGLCYHWTEDLMKRLKSLDLKAYQLHWGVAYRGSELREHNSVVITAKDQAFEEGIVLDPWRNSGELYWALVKSDRYPWHELPPSEW